MNCASCGKENPAGARFCGSCGIRLYADPPPDAPHQAEEQVPAIPWEPEQDATFQEQVLALQRFAGDIAAEISRISQRVSDLEGVRATPAAPPTAGPSIGAPLPYSATPSPAPPAPRSPMAAATPAGGQTLSASPGGLLDSFLGPGLSEKMKGWNWEWLLGGNWLARIGVAALVIGVGFFLKLASDNDWIGETGRVALGILGGIALLGAGEYWQRHYPIWAQALTGGGIAILYLSIFAAFSFYQLIPPLAALGFSFLITLIAAGLALRYDSFTIAALGIIGGFLAPLLLSEQIQDQRAVLAYVLVLDLGVLVLATFRNWRWFTLLGLLASLGLFWFWLDRLDPDPLLAQVGITAIFLIFMGATTLFHVIWRRPAGPMDHALMVINAAAFFGVSYGLLFDDFRPWMGAFTLLLAAAYGLLAYAVLKRSEEQVYLSLFALGISLVFLTIAVPVQLGGPWVSVAWAVEGVVLIWLSSKLRMNPLRWMGLVVFLIFAGWLLLVDTPDALTADIQPFLNVYTLTYAMAVGAVYLAAYLLQRNREDLQPWEGYVFSAFLVGGSLILTIAVPVQVSGTWLAITWAIEGVVLTWLSFRLELYQLRLFALGVFTVMVVRLLAFDTFAVDSQTFKPVLNERFLAFTVSIVAVYLAAYLYRRWQDKYYDESEKVSPPVLMASANFLSLWLLSAEVITAVDSYLFAVPAGIAGNVMSLSLSILWALYAITLMVVGIAGHWRWVRIAGLGLLVVPVVKLFGYDVFELEQEYRVAAFLSLGAILVAGGFLYQRFRGAIRGFLLE